MLPWLILIPAMPLAGFVVVGILGSAGWLRESWAQRIAVGFSALSLVFSIWATVDFAGGLESVAHLAESEPDRYEVVVGGEEVPARFEVTYAEWLPLGEAILRPWAPGGERTADLTVGWTFSIDALTIVMLLMVTFVGTLIHVYSIGYMEEEKRTFRFFAYLNLFMAMMLTLILAGNILVMFVGWEGVGLCSYLLIGYYYDRPFDKESGLTCADAGRKAFITNRIGDFGFLIGALLLLVVFGTFDFSELAQAINEGSAYWYGSSLLAGIGILLFIGATGKSAQIPLYVWLPDAMAGPTPVSALIHAATMVTAGVYMLARMSALFWHAPLAMLIVATVGCLTAVVAATMGMAQYDIKKVLAYSTVSQLGYMFVGAGVGAFAAAIFHLVTHAFFKACLFLGAGSVISRCGHSNDMRQYGGLKKFLPLTHATFLIATLAITGFPFLSGFMSKDAILAEALFANRGVFWIWLFALLGAVMTSFYMFRALWMTFYGENRSSSEVREHLRESPGVMTGVLVVLAIGAALIGFLGVPHGVTKLVGLGDLNWFAHQVHPVVAAHGVVAGGHGHSEHGDHAEAPGHAPEGVIPEGATHPTLGQEWGLFILAIAVFSVGLALAVWAFGGDGSRAESLGQRLSYVRRLLHRKWFVDELYDRVVLSPFYRLSRAFDWLDRWIVDGAVNLSAGVAEFGAQALKLIQTGMVRHYALILLAGAVVVLWIMTA